MRFTSSGRVRTRICEDIPTADGTRLSADVYLPPDPGSYPALITLTPYDNNRSPRVTGGAEAIPAKADLYRELADNGYVVAAVDVRGRGDSDGAFVPFAKDATDGADALTWVRTLEECNGRLGVFGTGYAGFAGLAAAIAAEVDAVFAASPFGMGPDGLLTRGGAVRLEWLFWMHLVAGRTIQPVDIPRWPDVFDHLPVTDMPEVLGRDNIWWADWLAHLDPADDHWSSLRQVQDGIGSLSAPLLLLTGWWDTNKPATLGYWQAATGNASNAARELIVGPWDTAGSRSPARHLGGVDFGADATIELTDVLLDWFDRHLKTSARANGGQRARVFVTGADGWASVERWPHASEGLSLWLSSDGRANTRAGDGMLVPDAPGDGQPADSYIYDPARPAPWQPAFTSFSRDAAPLALDESHLTTRDDVLVYTTDPADRAWTLAGACQLILYATTDAPDTDWIATLCDVFPYNGVAINLTHAVVRASASPGFTPGKVSAFTLTFPDIAHQVQSGHALRLTITSSLFPLYARNPNTPDYLTASETAVAHQRIHHDARHPSCLTLPSVTLPLAHRATRTGWFR